MIQLEINGNKQWIYIRGKENAPLLLFLHGGPGITSGIYLEEPFFQALEQDYLVVYWDQRCAGKSFSFRSLTTPISPSQLIEDTKELSRYLLHTYKQEKLVLLGFSYGAYIGIHAVKDCPELYDYYVAIGQPVHDDKAMLEGYAYLEKLAKETNNVSLVKKLKKIGQPPYKKETEYLRFRFILDGYGGFRYERKTKLFKDYIKPLFSSKVYSFFDKCKWLVGLSYSLTHLSMEEDSLTVQNTTLQVPSLFLAGEKDYITPLSLVEELFELSKDSVFHCTIIPKAAHDVHLEQPDVVLGEIKCWREKISQNGAKKGRMFYNHSKNNEREVRP